MTPPYPCDLSLEPGNLPPFLESTGQEKANSRILDRQLHLYSFQKERLTVERLRSVCGCAGSCLDVHTCERGFEMNEQRSAFMNWTSKTSLLGSRELLAQFLPCFCLQVQRFLMCTMERCRESSFFPKSRFLTEGPPA